MSIGVAFSAFFKALFDREVSQRIAEALKTPAAIAEAPKPAPAPKTSVSGRSEALTLLSTLQREARFLDLVHESLDGFEDAQIGAAAREVLKDCRKAMDRMFAIQPLAESDEGAEVEIRTTASPNQQRLIGKSSGGRGTVTHRGWQAKRCELPTWSGSKADAMLLAPIEIEVS